MLFIGPVDGHEKNGLKLRNTHSASCARSFMGCMFTFMFYCMLGKESIVKFCSLFYLIFASILPRLFYFSTNQNKRDIILNRTSDLQQDASTSL